MPSEPGGIARLWLGRCAYEDTWGRMRAFTAARTPESADELWLLEHDSVFTFGQAGRAEHLLDAGTIPVVRSDRGGQVTYHGPGQLVIYVLFDLLRAGIGVRALVSLIEDVIIAQLAAYGVLATTRAGAPGVYVADAKIAALGLRIRHGRSYHGLALNIDMDLAPFERIHPCGYPGLRVTQLRELGVTRSLAGVTADLGARLAADLAAIRADHRP